MENENEIELKLNINGTDYSAILNDDILFEICMPLFSKIKNLFLHILNDADSRVSDINDLIMVGGSSRLKVVRRFLKELLEKSQLSLAKQIKWWQWAQEFMREYEAEMKISRKKILSI